MSAQRGTERQYLDDQAAHAKAGMIETLREMKVTALKAADPRISVRKHPWIVAGSAVAAGFLAGALLTPATRNRVRPERTPTSANVEPATHPVEPATHPQEPPTSATASWWSAVVIALTTVAITAVQGALTSAVDSHFANKEGADAT
jgi:hypothetical protein